MKIITITLNPAFDVHCSAEHFEACHENLATITEREAGGKGVNISRALTMNGVDNLALLAVGDANGADFCRELDKDGMTYEAIELKGRIRENITIHTKDAPETRLSFTGFATDERNRLRKRDIDGTTVIHAEVELVGNLAHRAFFHARTATRADIFFYETRSFLDFNVEIANKSGYFLNLTV